jgi:hypothetical protein
MYDSVHFVTLGYDCSPAAVLRNLNLRNFALPFDWVVSNILSLNMCFNDNFSMYHTHLRFINNKRRLIDEYGFQFPHDYPLNDNTGIDEIGEGAIGEDMNKTIADDYMKYYDKVKEKYNRRVERFLQIMNDEKPKIILCRYNNNDVIQLYNLLIHYYKYTNIYIVNSSNASISHPRITNCFTEANGVWNEASIWKNCIDDIIYKLN